MLIIFQLEVSLNIIRDLPISSGTYTFFCFFDFMLMFPKLYLFWVIFNILLKISDIFKQQTHSNKKRKIAF